MRWLRVLAWAGLGLWVCSIASCGVFVLDAVLFDERFLGGIERFFVRLLCGDTSPDAQEAVGFGMLYALALLTVVALVSAALLLFSRPRRAAAVQQADGSGPPTSLG